MLISHSPPIYSHSPTGYSSPNNFCSSFRDLSSVPKLQRSASSVNKVSTRMPSVPRRPILVVRTSDEISSDEDITSPTKTKKKVVFADDRGMSLTQVRMMTEPSNVPPIWSKRFLAEVTQGISSDPVLSNNHWEITFPQPASDYIRFRNKLDSQKVCLENIIIKENENHIIGTVKVANLSFEKIIFLRYSCDDWVTHKDIYCSYVQNNTSSSTSVSAYVLHDTFTFNVNLPTNSKRFEFCVCYKCNIGEYWDNNDNKNYLLLKRMQMMPRSYSSDSFLKSQEKTEEPKRINSFNTYLQAQHAKIDSWSEFASWTHLENTSPYW
ncbi:hypothetical protein WA026_016607 [Henosepilachna vigintioctopunctata]|uniref:Protein phosphatase 1 regulatory subunit n=1 Tax=Henosepilachna vigintioctopunctata TaxID=420089 RepID=A0AAW1VHR6_9CUCU